jgi:hypothetical protein
MDAGMGTWSCVTSKRGTVAACKVSCNGGGHVMGNLAAVCVFGTWKDNDGYACAPSSEWQLLAGVQGNVGGVGVCLCVSRGACDNQT